MSDLQIEEVIEDAIHDEDVPPERDNYCHIDDGSGLRFYCGKLNEGHGHTCKPYDGEAICPSCGFATCPTCATMADLNSRLVDE